MFDVVALTDDHGWWDGKEEDETLLASLATMGLTVHRVSIFNETFDWDSTDLVILRSAWGKNSYMNTFVLFLDEIDQTRILLNPRKVLAWQANKAVYLMDLQAAGINIPQTIIYDPWGRDYFPSVKDIMKDLNCRRLIVKPQSGNAGTGVEMITRNNIAEWDEEFVQIERGADHQVNNNEEKLLGVEEYLIQCYQYQIKTKGERSLILIAGNVTHAVIKMPAEDNFLVHEGFGGTTELYHPTSEEIAFAEQVFHAVTDIVGVLPAYLRVDMIYDNDNKLALMELAAGTAHLWLTKHPAAADALATHIQSVLEMNRQPQQQCTQ